MVSDLPQPFCYYPGFMSAEEAAILEQELLDGVNWHHESLTLYGRRIPVPRLLAWFGEPGLNYRYSGTDHVCDGWLPQLTHLRHRLLSEYGFCSNLVLVNRYRDGSDYMGWHADDERGHGTGIASVSLGATRRFLLRPVPGERSVPLDLQHGSLLMMDAALRHALPRTRRIVAERINLTFRQLTPGGVRG